jgi:hypothetical protein
MATTVTLKPNAIDISGSTSGTTTLQATAVAGTTTLTLPAATDTLVGKATTDTLTNKTLTGAVMNGTLGATTPSTVAATSITASTTLGVTGVATFSAGTAALPAITTTGDTNTGIFFPAADTIAFTEGGAEAMRIDSSGNVGIGATAGTILDVYKASGNPYFRVYTGTGSVQGYMQAVDSTYVKMGALSNHDLGLVTNGTENVRITTAGNVGIGTTSPSTQLQMNSGAATYSDQLRIRNTNFGNADIGVGSGIMAVATDMSNIAFYTSSNLGTTGSAVPSNERMRIDSSGCMLINTSSSWSAGVKLQVYGSAVSIESAGTSADDKMYFRNGNGIVGSIATSGSATSYNTSSDYRLKNTITPMTGALAKVVALKPVTYKWNSNGSTGQGFIAHELAEVEAGCVTGEKDAVDSDGNPIYQGIDTSFLVATLTAAIQELNAKFEAYKATHP